MPEGAVAQPDIATPSPGLSLVDIEAQPNWPTPILALTEGGYSLEQSDQPPS